MEQEKIDRCEMILDLCVKAEEVLDDLTVPVVVPHEEYFQEAHLWMLEVNAVCSLLQWYYGGVVVCLQNGLNFPAAALTRCIHELFFRSNIWLNTKRNYRTGRDGSSRRTTTY